MHSWSEASSPMTRLSQKWAIGHIFSPTMCKCWKSRWILRKKFMSYVYCVWMPIKIQFRDSVECHFRKSRWVTSSTDLWITSEWFMYCVDVIYQPSGSSSSRLFSISVFAGPMCWIPRKIPQKNRPSTWRLSVRKSFFKTLVRSSVVNCTPNHVVLKFSSVQLWIFDNLTEFVRMHSF